MSHGTEWNVETTKWHCKPLGPFNKFPAMANYEDTYYSIIGCVFILTHSVIMLDEAHERTIHTDIAIGLLKKVILFLL